MEQRFPRVIHLLAIAVVLDTGEVSHRLTISISIIQEAIDFF